MDYIGSSNPVVFLYIKQEHAADSWSYFDKTEVMKNNQNPDFEKSFIVNYYFEKHQPIRLVVKDECGDEVYETIGLVETTLGTIMGSKNQTFSSDLRLEGGKGQLGYIIIKADSVKDSNWDVSLRIEAEDLPNTPMCIFCSKNNPFFEIYRGQLYESTNFLKVYDSEVVGATRSPVFNALKLSG